MGCGPSAEAAIPTSPTRRTGGKTTAVSVVPPEILQKEIAGKTFIHKSSNELINQQKNQLSSETLAGEIDNGRIKPRRIKERNSTGRNAVDQDRKSKRHSVQVVLNDILLVTGPEEKTDVHADTTIQMPDIVKRAQSTDCYQDPKQRKKMEKLINESLKKAARGRADTDGLSEIRHDKLKRTNDLVENRKMSGWDSLQRERFRGQLDLMRRFYTFEDIPLDFFIDEFVPEKHNQNTRRRLSKAINSRPLSPRKKRLPRNPITPRSERARTSG